MHVNEPLLKTKNKIKSQAPTAKNFPTKMLWTCGTHASEQQESDQPTRFFFLNANLKNI